MYLKIKIDCLKMNFGTEIKQKLNIKNTKKNPENFDFNSKLLLGLNWLSDQLLRSFYDYSKKNLKQIAKLTHCTQSQQN